MLCIIAFVIFLILFPILGFFPEYRRLFARSWECVFKKITLKPCDINLGEELKNKLLGKIALRFPKITKFLDKTFSFWAFLFVVLNIWSLVYVGLAGLNLFVYDTCEPASGEGCALSGDSCSISIDQLTFDEALKQDKLLDWSAQPAKQFGETVSRIPSRLQNWEAKDYLAPTATYYKNNPGKPTALEIIDPGCPSCMQLWNNIKQTDFTDRYNLSFLVYPIPNKNNLNGYRFNNSKLLAKYIETLKQFPLNSDVPAEWQFLNKIFTEKVGDDNLQFMFSQMYQANSKQAVDKIELMLKELGYSNDKITEISTKAQSGEVENNLVAQKNIVENKIKTLKIPTILFGGRRYDRVVDVETLKKN